MCFYHDYEWTAEVHTASCCRAAVYCRCDECDRMIAPGEWTENIWQQEHEMCQVCEDDCSDRWLGLPEDFESPADYQAALAEHVDACDYGETFAATICRECCLLLAAIYDLERREGCPEDARQPAYGELQEAMSCDDDRKYATHAVAIYPELAAHVMCAASNQRRLRS